MIRLNFYVLICSVLFVISNCELAQNSSDKGEQRLKTNAELTGTQWDLVSFVNEETEETDPGTVGIFIKFFADSTDFTVEGRSYQKKDGPQAGNGFAGNYKTDAPYQLSIEILGTTKVGEPDGSRYMEFLAAIQEATSFEVNENRLFIYKEEEKIMEFEVREE